MTATIINFTYAITDDEGQEISLLENILPYNSFYLLEDYVIDGGDFDIAEGYGIDVDAGNFDTGLLTTISYSYESGDFDTGNEVFYPDFPIVDENSAIDGGVDYKDPDRYYLMNYDFEPLRENEIPRNTYLLKSVLEPSFDVAINNAFTFEIGKSEKFFVGFDYGGPARGLGLNLNFGSILESTSEDFDFNSIINNQEPYPDSYVLL